MKRQKATIDELPDLPVKARAAELCAALRDGHLILSAEPGSGKTTLAPLLLLDETWLAGRKIVMLEPRRPAARMAARRMAALLNEPVGGTVGYQVRFDRKVSADTRIEVLTEGLLLRRLQADPELSDVGLLIFDEFHERNLQTDLSLALALDVVDSLRQDLRLLVMSASIDSAPLARLLPAAVLSVEGRTFPVSIQHADQDAELRDPVPACLRALAQAIDETSGDVLVFLPGRREIDALREQAIERWGKTLRVDSLYGDMSAEEQDRVLYGHGQQRRVILSTDIAETSLTIEGIGAVVDSGLARKPLFDPNTGLTRLETRWISKASALQRSGRAGRLGPGSCFRAWSTARQQRLTDWTPAEIGEADLAPLVLELANWGVDSADQLRWLDPPSKAHWTQAADLLHQLGAVDAEGRINAVGRDMARLPVHPRLAHLLAGAGAHKARRLAADIAALLSERDPLRADRRIDGGADISSRLDALANWRSDKAGVRNAIGLRRIDQTAQQLMRLLGDRGDNSATVMSPGRALALAYPDRVAMCTSADGRRYLMRNGRAALLRESDALAGARYLAVGEVDAGRRDGVIRLAAPLSELEFDELFADAIVSRREVRWDAKQQDVIARRVRRLDAITLSEKADALGPDDPVDQVLFEQLRRQGLFSVFKDPAQLRARMMWMRSVDPDKDWPDVSEKALLDNLDEWLAPWLKPGVGVAQLRKLSLADMLTAFLGWERMQQLDALLPTHLDTPAGTRRSIDYAVDDGAVLAVPLQEVLGMHESPQLAHGKVPLVLHLLSPAGRPLQVTSDLSAFWAGAYNEVKKEMRGRYPKHYWPDNPADAQATRFTKRRMRDG